MCYVNLLVLSICYVLQLVKGDKNLLGPENVRVSLEFVNNIPLITVTWDPPLLNDPPNNIKINSYEVAIFNLSNTVDSQQVQDTYLVDNQTTSWSISNVTLSAKYHASVRVNYSTGYSEAINTSAIGIRFLQNFTTNISGNLLRARCRLVKSDLFVDCQLVILNAEKNSKVLSPVNIMQSNFSVLLPSSKDKFLVTARAVDIHGDTVDLEKFNISYVITPVVTPTLDYMNPASLSDTADMCEGSCSMLTPLAIWLIIIILLILLMILIALIIMTLRKGEVCRRRKKPLRKSAVSLASIPPANDSELTSSVPIPNLIPNTLLPFKSKEDLPLKPKEDPLISLRPKEDPPLKSQEDSKIGPYENISAYPKPLNVRHSHIQIQECPAYRTLDLDDYDDICPTAVIMQPNPAYKHDMFGHNT